MKPMIRLKAAHESWDPVNTKADLARKPKEEDIDEERELEAMKKWRVCAKNEIEGRKVLHSRKMQPGKGLPWIVDRVFFMTVNADQIDQR